MDLTKVTNQNGLARRQQNRISASPSWSLTAEAYASMTLAEILEVTGLPTRLAHGDRDHEETTEALDIAVLNLRAA